MEHAKLCLFAVKYKVVTLQPLCLQRLQRLMTFQSFSEFPAEIIQLLAICYEDSFPPEAAPLRKLVLHNVAVDLDVLLNNNALLELLRSSHKLCLDLVMTLSYVRQPYGWI